MEVLKKPIQVTVSLLGKAINAPAADHRKLVIRFALVQALIITLFFVIFAFKYAYPVVMEARGYANKVVDNANFTVLSLDRDTLEIDIKPQIYSQTVFNDDDSRITVVVSQVDQMNPFYWDDRLLNGRLVKVHGVAFTKETMNIKLKDELVEVPYSRLLMDDLKLTKKQLSDTIGKTMNRSSFNKYLAISSIVVFFVSYILGVVMHLLFALIAGFVVASVKLRLDRYYKPAVKAANYAYIPFFVIISLCILAKLLIPGTNLVLAVITVFELILFLAVCYVIYRLMPYIPLRTSREVISEKPVKLSKRSSAKE